MERFSDRIGALQRVVKRAVGPKRVVIADSGVGKIEARIFGPFGLPTMSYSGTQRNKTAIYFWAAKRARDLGGISLVVRRK